MKYALIVMYDLLFFQICLESRLENLIRQEMLHHANNRTGYEEK